jgi:hypothetical protein
MMGCGRSFVVLIRVTQALNDYLLELFGLWLKTCRDLFIT